MKLANRCIYCGYSKGNTKEHIVPRSLLTDLRIYIDRSVEGMANNIAPCCELCNHTKSNRFILPLPENIATSYVNTPSIYLQNLAWWIVEHYTALMQFFSSEARCLEYEVTTENISKVRELWYEGYYDKLSDLERNVPYNEFSRSTIRDKDV